MGQNGISYQRSEVRLAQVTDGTSHTYCVGEKYLPQDVYKSGTGAADDQSLFAGHDFDNNRHTGSTENVPLPPLRDGDVQWRLSEFGSAHPANWNAAFCDGSVQAVGYDIDPEVHRLRGSRNDSDAAKNSQRSRAVEE